MRRRDRDLAADRLAALTAGPRRAEPRPPETRPPEPAAVPPSRLGPRSYEAVRGPQPPPSPTRASTVLPPDRAAAARGTTADGPVSGAGSTSDGSPVLDEAPSAWPPATGWTPARGAPDESAPAAASTAALGAAARAYADAHGRRDRADRRPARPAVRVRWSVTPRTAATAAIAVLLVGGAVALRAARAAPGDPVVLPTPALAVESSSSPVHVTEVVVDVVGEVAAPGVVRLPAGSRVADAVAAAGGPTASAHLASINLARVLVDGEQLVVAGPGDPPAPAGPSAASTGAAAPVDVNTADAATLDTLPGVGPVLAQRIVDARAHRPFSTVDELADVPGIGPALLARLRPLVRT